MKSYELWVRSVRQLTVGPWKKAKGIVFRSEESALAYVEKGLEENLFGRLGKNLEFLPLEFGTDPGKACVRNKEDSA